MKQKNFFEMIKDITIPIILVGKHQTTEYYVIGPGSSGLSSLYAVEASGNREQEKGEYFRLEVNEYNLLTAKVERMFS